MSAVKLADANVMNCTACLIFDLKINKALVKQIETSIRTTPDMRIYFPETVSLFFDSQNPDTPKITAASDVTIAVIPIKNTSDRGRLFIGLLFGFVFIDWDFF